jgi:hypothetical protein
MNPESPTQKRLSLEFPENERNRREKLIELFTEWRAAMTEALPDDKKPLAEGFVWDGFYPYYFNQPLKILFVGKESLDLAGCDYLEEILNAYRETKKIGKQHLNVHRFHNRLLYVAYGLIHRNWRWQDIPYADRIGDDFATSKGISFAFMNVSKFSNESENWQADIGLMQTSVASSSDSRSFVQEEIALLAPDLVISMNLGPFLDALGSRDLEVFGKNVNRSLLTSAGHKSLLLNTWHFSYLKAKDIEDIYLPICDAVEAAGRDGWLERP